MGGADKIKHARETLLLFLKSLPVGCYFNVVGFGSRHETLFTGSVPPGAASLTQPTSTCLTYTSHTQASVTLTCTSHAHLTLHTAHTPHTVLTFRSVLLHLTRLITDKHKYTQLTHNVTHSCHTHTHLSHTTGTLHTHTHTHWYTHTVPDPQRQRAVQRGEPGEGDGAPGQDGGEHGRDGVARAAQGHSQRQGRQGVRAPRKY